MICCKLSWENTFENFAYAFLENCTRGNFVSKVRKHKFLILLMDQYLQVIINKD